MFSHPCKPLILKNICFDGTNHWIRERLQGIPEKLEALISEKRFLGAVELLQDALTTMRKPNMDDIGAISDLRVYLSNQEHVCPQVCLGYAPRSNKNVVFDRHSN
jgi:hypothetical protein